jgi:hypothetical protein
MSTIKITLMKITLISRIKIRAQQEGKKERKSKTINKN